MMMLTLPVKSLVSVVAVLALAMLAGASGIQPIGAHVDGEVVLDEVIHACFNDGSGTVKIVSSEEECNNGWFPLDWNGMGIQGPAGADGATGPAGPAGPAGSPDNDWSGAGTGNMFATNLNDNVGIGTSTPTTDLEVSDSGGADVLINNTDLTSGSVSGYSSLLLRNDRAGGADLLVRALNEGNWGADFGQSAGGIRGGVEITSVPNSTNGAMIVGTRNATPLILGTNGSEDVRIDSSGNVGIGETSPTHPLQMTSGAHVTTGGVWTDASSRVYKENIRDLTTEEAMAALRELRPTRFNYKVDKEEEYVGFIAEDVPELVANKNRNGLSPMDILAVLTKVVQEQDAQIAALEERVAAMEAR